MVMVCQHSRRRVPASLLGAALYAHRLVIVGDRLYENPFYRALQVGMAEPHDVL